MTVTDPTAEQIEQYQRDGFLIVEQWLDEDEVERTRERAPGATAESTASG